MHHFPARYLASRLNRWLTPDPAGAVDGLNPYVYTQNNPLRYVDPTGHEKLDPDQLRVIGSMMGVGEKFNYETLAASGTSFEGAMDSMKQAANQDWESSGGPGRLDAIKEASAGFGDKLAWFVPTKTMREAAGVEVDQSSGYYKGGSVVGFVAALVLPFKAGPAAGAAGAATTGAPMALRAGAAAEEGGAVVQMAAPAARNAATAATQPSLAYAATAPGAAAAPTIASTGTQAAQATYQQYMQYTAELMEATRAGRQAIWAAQGNAAFKAATRSVFQAAELIFYGPK